MEEDFVLFLSDKTEFYAWAQSKPWINKHKIENMVEKNGDAIKQKKNNYIYEVYQVLSGYWVHA